MSKQKFLKLLVKINASPYYWALWGSLLAFLFWHFINEKSYVLSVSILISYALSVRLVIQKAEKLKIKKLKIKGK